ncbi:MAG: lipoyl(octanoyl) transferase LipB [Dehalococcoidia bacterium]
MTEASHIPSQPDCQVVSLGVVDYRQAWDLQVKLVHAVHDGTQPNTLLLLEHPHVYTKGRLSKPEQVLAAPDQLEQLGIPVVETDRGGLVTYHGPGQLVGYPVVNLREWGGPLKYVRTLEQIIIRTLADFGVAAGLVEGLTGVWAGEAKVAAIGVKISRGVAHHGFAINVNTDLAYFQHIIPCGITDREVTSLAQLLGQPVDMQRVQARVARHFGQGMGFRMVETEEHTDSAAKLVGLRQRIAGSAAE